MTTSRLAAACEARLAFASPDACAKTAAGKASVIPSIITSLALIGALLASILADGPRRSSLPNGSRSSCGRNAHGRKSMGRSPCPARGTTLGFL